MWWDEFTAEERREFTAEFAEDAETAIHRRVRQDR